LFWLHFTRGWARRLAGGADAALQDADGETALHKAASQARARTQSGTQKPNASEKRANVCHAVCARARVLCCGQRADARARCAQGHAAATRALLAACPAAAALRDRYGHTPAQSATGDAARLLPAPPPPDG
jgi:hypothetical protein